MARVSDVKRIESFQFQLKRHVPVSSWKSNAEELQDLTYLQVQHFLLAVS